MTAVPLAATATTSANGTSATGTAGNVVGAHSEQAAASTKRATVTLITGDRVRLNGSGGIESIQPATGRRNIVFTTSTQRGELSVVPSDAAPLISSGAVDPRLFNVSLLVRYGYDDAKRTTVPTIARGVDRGAGGEAMKALGMRTPRAVKVLRGYAGGVDKKTASSFWSTVKDSAVGVTPATKLGTRVWLDGQRRISLDRSVAQIGAPTAWAAGFTGKGVVVAVLDTGIDLQHPDFAGRVVASSDFSGVGSIQDTVGHGTHVASTIAGSGAGSSGRFRGVAPDASLAIGRVCAGESCDDSAVLAGMQWAAETVHARVVSMSLGSVDSSGIDPLEEAVNTLSASTGALFVVAAGNDFCSVQSTVGSPSTAEAALSVGAVNRDGSLADFSSCGPRPGDGAVKPEITAPGRDIVAARSSTGFYPPTDSTGYYTALSGTSMATPHVAGAAAIVAQEHPTWTGSDIKALLVATAAASNATGLYMQGAGLVNVGITPQRKWFDGIANITFGVQAYPHSDDPLLTRRLPLHNDGAKPVTLNLSVHAASTTGVAAPPGMFYLSTTQITLPAGGSATVDLTANTTVNVADGNYAGTVVATDGSQTSTTLFSVAKEPESYDLTVISTDASGQPTNEFSSTLTRLDGNIISSQFVTKSTTGDGKTTMHLEKGVYRLNALSSNEKRTDILVAPAINLDRNMTVSVDARTAALQRFTVPDAAAVPLARFWGIASWGLPKGGNSTGVLTFSDTQVYVGRVGPVGPIPVGHFTFAAGAEFGHYAPDDSLDTTYPVFHLAESTRDVMPVGFSKTYQFKDLAQVKVVLPPTKDTYNFFFLEPHVLGSSTGAVSFLTATGTRRTVLVNYVNAAPDLQWQATQDTYSASFSDELLTVGPGAVYAPGTTTILDFRSPRPFSPTLTSTYKAFGLGLVPSMVNNDPASRLAPGLRLGRGDGTDTLLLTLQPFGDVYGQSSLPYSYEPGGYSLTFTLSKDGKLLAQNDVTGYQNAQVQLPSASSGTFTMTLDATNLVTLSGVIGLPTRTTTVWTFKSTPAGTKAWETLPLSVVRIGKVSGDGKGKLSFPVQVQRQATMQPVLDSVRSLSVEVSGNGGATWTAGKLKGSGSDWTVSFPGLAFASAPISVRATAVSDDGSKVQETLIGIFGGTGFP